MIVQNSPRDSALFRVMNPDTWQWGLAEHLLSINADAAIMGNWMQSKDGQKNRNRPKPLPRPGVEQDKKFGGKAESIESIRDWLGW